jgi:hypothetical protein
VLRNNTADLGGAVYIENSAFETENCTFLANKVKLITLEKKDQCFDNRVCRQASACTACTAFLSVASHFIYVIPL